MKTIGIIGAGTMGSGIAYVAATAGCPVLLNDISDERLHNALQHIQSLLSKAVEKKLLSSSSAEETVLRIRTCQNVADLSPSTVVVEAAVEDLNIKKEIFRQLNSVCAHDAILTSNTSSLSITELASVVQEPERVAGMHFFNPPHVMKLVEIIKGHLTSEQTISTLVELTKSFGRVPVVVKDTPGFIVNRIARPFYLEALRLLGEGVSTIEEIDRIVRLEGGFKMGPFELMDLIGIDVNYAVTQSVYEQFFHEPRFRPHPIQRQMVQSGMLGRKTGKGFYEYPQ
jgi:3-hydroxybutyryl-CoA dehydrogenase